MDQISLVGVTAEDLFSQLVQKGNGGTVVRSMAAPALSTQFVKSKHKHRAQPGAEGSFAQIIVPSLQDTLEKQATKHEGRQLFGYSTTIASDSYPAGYGERSARALQREENTFQLKGTFSAASLAYSKLKARIEARDGDVTAVDRVFAKCWGLTEEQATTIPVLHLAGSEPTRMAAMEDRAYHALSGHPAHTGGYRVDTATLTPDALGDDVPLHWPRLRTGLKAIATVQVQGDIEIAMAMRCVQGSSDVRIGMDMTLDSQTRYSRPYPWEKLVDRLLTDAPNTLTPFIPVSRDYDLGYSFSLSMTDAMMESLAHNPDLQIVSHVAHMARIVSDRSNRALRNTVDVMIEHDRDRALMSEYAEAEFDEINDSLLSTSFEVPRYKLTRTSLHKGLYHPNIGPDDLPDVSSHGKSQLLLDLREFREARLAMPIDIAGALNIAVYLTVLNTHSRTYAYMLMAYTSSRDIPGHGPISQRLRNQTLFRSEKIRALGAHLFSDFFLNTFEMLLRNMTTTEYRNEVKVKIDLWDYLSSRCAVKRKCPCPGGWRDLVVELRELEEGWSLYYWVRVAIGKRHYALSTSILAPMAAGDQVDFITMMKRGVKERARSWSEYYAAQYKVIEGKLSESNRARKKDEDSPSDRYIPPHLRQVLDLEGVYDADAILNRDSRYRAEEYQRMVEMQSKSKFFSSIEVYVHDRSIVVGMSDDKLRDTLIEFYQARWYSLQKRIEKATKAGKVFRLGIHKFPVHPWGELETNLPISVYGMLNFMTELDQRAWTIPPDYLQNKFRKSISELWEDITNEMNLVLDYIKEVHESLADEQEAIDESRRVEAVMSSMSGVAPIPIPAAGYRAPYHMPQRSIAYTADGGTTLTAKSVLTSVNTYVDKKTANCIEPPPPTSELTELDDEEMMDISMFTGSLMDKVTTIISVEVPYLTYREIWFLLGLPDVPSEVMKCAYGIDVNTDLDNPHLDSTLGPIHLRGEEFKVVKAWAHKLPMMKMRLRQGGNSILTDDM